MNRYRERGRGEQERWGRKREDVKQKKVILSNTRRKKGKKKDSQDRRRQAPRKGVNNYPAEGVASPTRGEKK